MTLQEILKAKGMTEEAIESTIGEMKQNKIFTTSHENMDVRYPKLKTDHENLTAQYGESSKLIEQLKAGTKDNEALQGKITSYEAQIATLREQLHQAQLDGAARIALLEADVKPESMEFVLFKMKEKGEMELDDNGLLKNKEDRVAGLKTQLAEHFKTAAGREIIPRVLPTGADPNLSVTKEQFSKMGYNERLQLKQANEQLYRQLAAQ